MILAITTRNTFYPCGHDIPPVEDDVNIPDREKCCIGLGPACSRCGIAMPESEDAPRLCPNLNDDVNRQDVKDESPYNYDEQ